MLKITNLILVDIFEDINRSMDISCFLINDLNSN